MKKQKNKKMTLEGLAGLMKQGFKKNQEEMAIMVKDALQGTQDLLMGEIGSLKGEVGSLRGEMKVGFEKVNKEINKINLNVVDVVRKEEFDKLENRVVVLEQSPRVPAKKS